jgi:hypothetical protein
MTRRAVLAAALLALGCAYHPPPVRMEASPAELAKMAGHWTGGYTGWRWGGGSIVFTLVPGEDHAHGDVLMTPRGALRPYRPWRDPARTGVPGRLDDTPLILGIAFVHVEDGEVEGALDPYFDPECECRALTRFRGRLRGDVIEGTYVTVNDRDDSGMHGTWRVRRSG